MNINKNKAIKFCFLTTLISASGVVLAEEITTSFYGSLRLGLDYVDAGTVDDAANGRDYLSRIGGKASVVLSDTLTGIGKVEYGMRGDDGVNFVQNEKAGLRQIYIGLKGDFGTVTFGSQTILWHKFVRDAYFSDGLDSLRQGAIRDDDFLQWEKSIGDWRFGAALQTEKQDGDSIDQYQLAAQYQTDDWKLQAAVASDQQGENKGSLYGVRAWYELTANITVSAFYHLAEADFDIYAGNSSGNVRLKSTAESGDVGGVSACKGEDRSTTGLYGNWRLDKNQVHARYAINACESSGDVNSIKLEYVRHFSKSFRLWAAFEQLDSDTMRMPTTGEDMSELQLGGRFDF